MKHLNYHHLWHFFVIAREGGLRMAAESLTISPSTLSEQMKVLEKNVGGRLFVRAGRGLRLTELGRHVHGYAESIFRMGNALVDSIQHGQFELRVPLRVGVVNAMPKVIVYHLLEPLFDSDPVSELTVAEDEMPRLLMGLVNDEFDVVLSDSPIPPHHAMGLYNHFLGESELGVFVSKKLSKEFAKLEFPECLNDREFLMPTTGTVLSRELERWFDGHSLNPKTHAHFENSSLLKFFGSRAHGAFAAPVIAREDIEDQYGCNLLGIMEGVNERYYALTPSRRLKHPGVILMYETARNFMTGVE